MKWTEIIAENFMEGKRLARNNPFRGIKVYHLKFCTIFEIQFQTIFDSLGSDKEIRCIQI